jgi:hypothetical protein
MKPERATDPRPKQHTRQAFRVRLPGFLVEGETGLGDVIKRATSAVGIQPCAGCERRAAALNRWVVFTNWH